MTLMPLALVDDVVQSVLRSPSTVFNQYTEANEDDAPKWGPNLRALLMSRHIERSARMVLVGEAPGYQGARITGVPFTSERLVLGAKIPGLASLVPPGSMLSTKRDGWAEPSATIVWSRLRWLDLTDDIVLWNACPWHPPQYRALPYSNRAPTQPELDAGKDALRAMIELHPVPFVAIGKVAEAQLLAVGKKPLAVLRHPANGGATKFEQGLREAKNTLDALQRMRDDMTGANGED